MTAPATDLKLNPLCRMPLAEPLTCELLLDDRSIELPDRRYLALLVRLGAATPRDAAVELAAASLGIEASTAREVIDDLVDHGVLVDAGAPRPGEPEAAFWVERNWLEGLVYHLETRGIAYADADGGAENGGRAVLARQGAAPLSLWKRYPDGTPTIELPPPRPPETTEPLASSMLRRRSNEPYRTKVLTLAQLGTMLHHGSIGPRRYRLEAERTYQTEPERFLTLSSWSAIETYVAAFAIDGLEPGLYHYDLRDHRLTTVRVGLTRAELVRCFLGQKHAADGACMFLFTAIWERFMIRYPHPRGFRNLLVNAAELAQRYLVLGTALGLSTYTTPQSLYRETQQVLGLPHYEEGLIYSVGVG